MSELRGGSQAPLGTVRLDFLRQDCVARTGAALPPGQISSSRGLHAPGLAPPLACLSPLGTQRPYLGSYLSEQEVGDAAIAPSRQDLEAHRLELAPSVVHRQLLVHAPLAPVPVRRPGTDSLRQFPQRPNLAVAPALAPPSAPLVLRDVQQLPGFSVKHRSRRHTSHRSSEALDLLERTTRVGVLRLSQSHMRRSRCAEPPFSRAAASIAQTVFVRCGRQPASGSGSGESRPSSPVRTRSPPAAHARRPRDRLRGPSIQCPAVRPGNHRMKRTVRPHPNFQYFFQGAADS